MRRAGAALPRAPYKGLLPYGEADAGFFFGRETERQLVAANLMAARLTVLYGPSGVGKTSVLDAGVTPDLVERVRDALDEEDTPQLALVVFRTWHGDPAAGLAAAVAEAVRELLPDHDLDDPPGDAPLADVLEHWSKELDGRLLIVLDQFEEYFVYSSVGDRFDEELPRAVNRSDLRANFLISIREDALARLDRFKGRIPYLFDNYLRIDRLDLKAGREAIEGPLRRWAELGGGKISIEPELVDEVLEQARPDLTFGQAGAGTADGGRPDRVEAPFLQLIMRRLWAVERQAGSAVLRASTLHDLGGAKGIVRSHLNEGLDLLTRKEKNIAAHLFQFLVTRSGQKVAHTALDLADFSGLDLQPVTAVLERLSRPEVRILRRVEAAAGEEDAGALYEIYHDTLGEPILAWRSAHFVRKARRRATLWAASALTMLVVAAACFALLLVAIHAKQSARSQKLVAQSAAALGVDPDAAVRLADRALGVKPTREAEEALRRAVGSSPLRATIRVAGAKGGAIGSIAYSADGRRVFAWSADGVVVVADARTGRRLTTIHVKGQLDVDFSKDGQRVLVASADGTLRFWRAKSPNPRVGSPLGPPFHDPSLSGAWLDPVDDDKAVAVGADGGVRIWKHGSRQPLVLGAVPATPLTSAAFSPDGRRVVVKGRGETSVWVLDARTGRLLHTLTAPTQVPGVAPAVDDVAWSGDGRVVTGGDDAWAYVWDASTGRRLVGVQEADSVNSVAFSADGTKIATAYGKRVHVRSSRNGRQLAELRGHGDLVTDVEFRQDGRVVVTASNDGTARIWDVADEATIRTLRGHKSFVESAIFSPDGRSVLTGSADGTARVWDASTGRELWSYYGPVLDAAFSPDGRHILTAGQDYRIFLWNVRGGSRRRSLPDPPRSAVNSIRFSPDGKLAVTAENSGALIVRSTSTWKPVATNADSRVPAAQAVFSPNGKRIAAALADGYVGIYDSGTATRRKWLREPDGPGPAHPLGGATGVAWSDDGRFVVTTGTDSLVKVWNPTSGSRLWRLEGHNGRVVSPAFAPGSDVFVTAGADRTARVWNAASGRAVAILHGQAPLASAAFSPDGRLVVTGDAAGVIRVWNWRQEKLLAVMPMHADFVNTVAFSPDGKRILSASDDWTAKIYRCETCAPLERLRDLVRRREQVADAGQR